ncbi:MAG: hypothetical protein J0665_20415 [Deltaproteobacteria bacterium]|nr:hypothetical protein [Deltaproteobacteria bacterium]
MIKLDSIRNKLVVAVSLFIAVLLVTIAAGTYAYFKHTTQKLIFDQQFSLITNVAKGLDDKILTAHNALIAVSKVAPVDVVDNLQVTQKWLVNRVGISSIFSHGLYVLNATGKLIASSPLESKLHGLSYAHRHYFINTVKSNRPQISMPFISSVSGHPVVMMTSLLYSLHSRG